MLVTLLLDYLPQSIKTTNLLRKVSERETISERMLCFICDYENDNFFRKIMKSLVYLVTNGRKL